MHDDRPRIDLEQVAAAFSPASVKLLQSAGVALAPQVSSTLSRLTTAFAPSSQAMLAAFNKAHSPGLERVAKSLAGLANVRGFSKLALSPDVAKKLGGIGLIDNEAIRGLVSAHPERDSYTALTRDLEDWRDELLDITPSLEPLAPATDERVGRASTTPRPG